MRSLFVPHRHFKLVYTNPLGGRTNAPQEDWPCLMDDGIATQAPYSLFFCDLDVVAIA